MFLFLIGFAALALLMKGKGQDLSLASTAASAIGLSPTEYLEGAMVAGRGGHGGGGGRGGFGGYGGDLYADAYDTGATSPDIYITQVMQPPPESAESVGMTPAGDRYSSYIQHRAHMGVGGGEDPMLTHYGEHEETTGAPVLYDDDGQRCIVAGNGSLVYF